MAFSSSRSLTRAHTLMKLLSPRIAAPFSVRSSSSATLPTTCYDSNPNFGSGNPMHGSDLVFGFNSGHKIDYQTKLCPNGEVCPHVHPFLRELGTSPRFQIPGTGKEALWIRMGTKGLSLPCKVMIDKEALYVRFDMPGTRKEGLKLWVEDKSLHVKGYGVVEEEKMCSPLAEQCRRRKYYCNLDIPRGYYKVEEIAAELKNGVLSLKIPKRKHIIDVKVKCPDKNPGDHDYAIYYALLALSVFDLIFIAFLLG